MSAVSDWREAFPLHSAKAAADALLLAWTELASMPKPGFNRTTKEPNLTKRLKIYLENCVSRECGLLGMWAAEDIIGELDPETGVHIEERRTDIVYGWNNHTQDFKLVFEFKRLGKQKRYRDNYLGDEGLGRFVTGIYSRRQAIAAMVGVLLHARGDVVPPILGALATKEFADNLRLRTDPGGMQYTKPSTLFPQQADFDTEHNRDPDKAPLHGYIRVAHFFLEFGEPYGG